PTTAPAANNENPCDDDFGCDESNKYIEWSITPRMRPHVAGSNETAECYNAIWRDDCAAEQNGPRSCANRHGTTSTEKCRRYGDRSGISATKPATTSVRNTKNVRSVPFVVLPM